MCIYVRSFLSCASLTKNSSSQIRVSLADEFGALLELLLIIALLSGVLDEYTRCGALGLASLSDLGSALHVDVGDILLFAENRKVAQNING